MAPMRLPKRLVDLLLATAKAKSVFSLLLSSLFCLPDSQMWACALGHLEAAVVLYKWDRRAISIPDSLGRLPLGIARSRGHVKLAECLEHLQRDEQAQLGQTPRIHCAPSEEPSTDSWMAQWHREAMSSPEIPKGVTVIASTNPGTNSQGFHLGTCQLPHWLSATSLRRVRRIPTYF